MDKSKYFKLTAVLIVLLMTIGNSKHMIAQDIHISTNTTWSTNQNPTGNVFVEQGATLSITSGVAVNMPANGYIIVDIESKLIADDAVFSVSGGYPNIWFGIYASGYGNSIDQVSLLNPGGEKQPELIFTDCSFYGMLYGINNANPLTGNTYTNSGGILKIEGCTFNGNSMGVRFYKYVHTRNSNQYARDLSYIYNSEFIIYSSPTLSPIGVYMHGAVGIRIHGCYFYSHNRSLTGVQASLSTFSIGDYYTGLPLNPIFVSDSKFSNCRYGIRTSNSNALMGKCLIRNTEFSAVGNSIYALNSDNIEVYSNTISIDQTSTVFFNNEQVGIYFENCATFYCENNNVSTRPNIFSIPITNTYGIVAHNCGENNNRFYRNTVSNCEYNIVGQEHNRGVVAQSGLQFLCNNLSQTNPTNPMGTDNTYYMAVLTTQPNNNLHGINDWQAGGAFNTTLNQFEFGSAPYNEIPDRALIAGSKKDFYNQHIQFPTDIQYKNPYLKTPLSQVLESSTMPPPPPTYEYYGDYIWVIDESSSFSNQCPNTVPSLFPTPTTLSATIANLQAVKIPYGPLKVTFAAYENNGDHQFMLNQVNNMNNTNYTTVFYYLMNNHPSTDVIAIAVGNDLLPDYMCTNVLITNSYGIKSKLVRDALSSRQNQLTSTQMTSINIAAQSQSQYESYLLELATLRTQINTLSTEKYNYYFDVYDDEIDLNEVILTLNDNENFYSYISLMMFYFDIGDIPMADDNRNLAMNAEEISELETSNLELLFNILIIVYENLEGDFSQLDQAEIDNLNDIATTDSKSGGIAKSILLSEFKYEFDPILLKATESSARMINPKANSNLSRANQMKIFPNPAENYIDINITESFEYPLQLNIYDISGKLVMQKEVDHLNTIIIDNLKSGLYNVKITDVNKKVFKQKLIIR